MNRPEGRFVLAADVFVRVFVLRNSLKRVEEICLCPTDNH